VVFLCVQTLLPKRRSDPAHLNLTEPGDAADVVRTLRRLFRAIHEYSKAVLARSGLSGPQVWALSLLAARPGLSAGELAERMFVHPSTLTGIVERLVRKGLISRTVDEKDKRGVRLAVTRNGLRLLKRTPPPVQVGLTRALSALPPRRLRELSRSLERIARETEADRVKAPFFDMED
jgi:MarR family transcriptional regulator, organic hydroperoxide resistance regulator